MSDPCLADIANALGDFIHQKRDETRYDGPVDMVCHCMGTCISRYLLEIIDKTDYRENARQLIGLGPPNNGSSIAELFCDPCLGREIAGRLAGTFIPEGLDRQVTPSFVNSGLGVRPWPGSETQNGAPISGTDSS
jgi:hypothetical protein